MKKRLLTLLAVAALGATAAWADKTTISTALDATTGITHSADVTIVSVVNDEGYNPFTVQGDSLVAESDQTNSGYQYPAVTITFRSDEPMVVTYNMFNGGSESYDYFYLHVDNPTGTESNSYNSVRGKSKGWQRITGAVYLSAGEHSVRFYAHACNKTSTSEYYHGENDRFSVHLSIVSPESQYSTIDLGEAGGTLGTEVIDAVGTLNSMRYLRLKGTLKEADWETIKNLTNLRALDMTDANVTKIPDEAFSANPLRFFGFPSVLKEIGEKVFYYKYLFGDIVLPDGLETIGERAFQGYYTSSWGTYTYYQPITSLTIPNTVTSIGKYAFGNLGKLTTVKYSEGMTYIPEYCFSECNALTTITGLSNVTAVNERAFENCKNLPAIDGLRPITVGEYAYYQCQSLKAIDLSRTTTIEGHAFYYCYALEAVDLSSLSSWAGDDNQFYECKALKKVVFPDRLTSVPQSAFRYCESLEEVVLGASMASLGSTAFSNCTALARIYCNAPTPPSIASSWPVSSTNGITLYVPSYAMTSYKLDDFWGKFNSYEVNTNTVENLTLAGALELTTNNRIPDSPNVVMNTGSSFVVNGNNAQPMGSFIGYYNLSSPSTLVSRCNAMTSTSTQARYYLGYSSNPYWYFLSLPFDVNVADITTSNGAEVAIRYYDGAARAANGTGNSWKDVAADGTLKAGQGYIFTPSKATWVYLPATDETHNQIFRSDAVTTTLAEYATETSSNKSWNLVGNPYPAYFDIYYMDYTAPITKWDTTNRGYTAYSVADDELALRPFEAFFVQKPDAVSSITFNTVGRQINNTIEHAASAPALRAPSAAQRKLINLTLSDGEMTDRTRIVVNPTATDAFDLNNDASKMFSTDAAAQLYTLADNEMYAINEGAHTSGRVQLGMWFKAAGSYTLDAPRADMEIHVFDNGSEVTLPYTFNSGAGYSEDRFYVTLGGNLTGIDQIENSESADVNAETQIYDLTGRRVKDVNLKGIYVRNGKKVVR